ncbi:MAG: formyltransferase family protein [Rhodocyclaceae bacterium]
MRLDRVVLLAAHTARSQAYLQAMLAAGLQPSSVITLGSAPAPHSVPGTAARYWQGVLLPATNESLDTICTRANIPVTACQSDDANSPETEAAIRNAHADVVIYSGRGGQLVAAHMLAIGPRFLHMHSGWLPAYRGSTTLYYALLNGEQPAVSALFLDEQIDTGPVLMRRHYAPPHSGMNVDSLYDSAIRADMLVRVLQEYVGSGQWPRAADPSGESSRTYYVIHPVLKHLALLGLHSEAA